MRTVVGVLPTVAEAKHVAHEFEVSGIARNEINVVPPVADPGELKKVARSRRSNAAAARAGALRGALLGLFLGGVALALPGVRPFLFGSAAASLAASVVGLAILMSALVAVFNMGRSHEEAGLYEEAVHERGVVIAAHVTEAAEPVALKLLDDNGARDVHAAEDVAHISQWTAAYPDEHPYPCDSQVTAH